MPFIVATRHDANRSVTVSSGGCCGDPIAGAGPGEAVTGSLEQTSPRASWAVYQPPIRVRKLRHQGRQAQLIPHVECGPVLSIRGGSVTSRGLVCGRGLAPVLLTVRAQSRIPGLVLLR